MGLIALVLGLAIFLATHVFVSMRGARLTAIARLGKIGYQTVFSIVSIAGLVLIVWGFAQYRSGGEWVDIWQPPAFTRHIAVLLMLFSVVFMTAVFFPSHIKAKLKHPMLASVKTWALAHLISNGDLGSILMFGTFLGWAVFARIAAKRRVDDVVAVAPSGYTNDLIVVLLGIVIYLALGFAFHPVFIGVPVFGR
ncbi:MAG: NnrU family protein [Pseudolabrys sp.]|nr:NnrU family protein [Pseudolabrys sp.]MDP2298786.1 NnrU family protein [Pseudolabrys sp.]